MVKWLDEKQQDYTKMLITTKLRSPFIMQRLLETNMTSNQLMEFNKNIKSLGRKLRSKGRGKYSLDYI